MPKPIVCLSAGLRQYLEAFRPCFSRRQWKYFVIVLLGLVECEERKPLTGLRRAVAEEISLSGLSRFLSQWPWNPEQVCYTWRQRFRCRLEPLVQAEHVRLSEARPRCVGRPKATVVTGYLIMDDSVHTKPKGRKMGGLGRHYSSSERCVVQGHCLFTGVYVLLGQRCPLPAAMYRQKDTCAREGVPFQSKIDLAVQQIETFEPVADTHTHVLIDSWYHCKQVRRAAQHRGWEISGGLKSNRVMRLVAEAEQREWLKLSDYIARPTPDDWQEITWPAEDGGQVVYAHLVKSWIRKLGPTLVLITCHDLAAPRPSFRYWGSTQLELSAQALADLLAIRWQVETFFEYDKDLLGSDHYQVMTTQAIVRFWTLTACLLTFLEEQRTQAQAASLTCGDIRRSLQQQHRQNLRSWLFEHFQQDYSAEQFFPQLALSSP
jgi:hypothetical protein